MDTNEKLSAILLFLAGLKVVSKFLAYNFLFARLFGLPRMTAWQILGLQIALVALLPDFEIERDGLSSKVATEVWRIVIILLAVWLLPL